MADLNRHHQSVSSDACLFFSRHLMSGVLSGLGSVALERGRQVPGQLRDRVFVLIHLDVNVILAILEHQPIRKPRREWMTDDQSSVDWRAALHSPQNSGGRSRPYFQTGRVLRI
jgi:hypothetical protein